MALRVRRRTGADQIAAIDHLSDRVGIGDGAVDAGVAIIFLGFTAIFKTSRHTDRAAGKGKEVGLGNAEIG